MSNIKQFKLSTGEEILCDVIEWADEDYGDIVVRKIWQIAKIDNDIRGLRLYTLKPWLTLQDDDDDLQTICVHHIVSECNPSDQMLKHFHQVVENAKMSDEEVEKKMKQHLAKIKNVDRLTELNLDSDSNIILFPSVDPGNDKVH